MSERRDDLRDDLVSARLESALGTTPPWLISHLEHLAAAGLHLDRAKPRLAWLDAARALAGQALSLAILAGVVSWALGVVMNPQRFDAVRRTLDSPGALSSLMLPIGMLLVVEAMRGAPTVRRWVG